MFFSQLTRLLTLQDANTRVVLLGTLLLGITAGVIGSFAMLRRRALIGDAVSHAALPGIAVGYFVFGDRQFWALLLGALVFGLLAAWSVSAVSRITRVKEDAALAIVIGTFFGLGIVLSRIIQNRSGGGNRAGLDGFIFGKAATMVRSDVMLIGAVCLVSLTTVALFYKELKLVVFDREYATAQGWPVARLDLLLMALLAVATVVGLPAVGLAMIVALLVIPACTARLWTDRLGVLLVVAGLIGGLSGVLGTSLSATIPSPAGSRGWPTGALIVIVAGAVFVVSFVASPKRGLIAAIRARSATLEPPPPFKPAAIQEREPSR